MRLFVGVFLLCLFPQVTFAQSIFKEDKSFWYLAGVAEASTIYDMEMTVRTLKDCRTCEEANPLARQLVGNRISAYVYGTGITAFVTYASHKIRRSDSPTLRKFWWVPQVGIALVHGFAGAHNQRIPESR